MLSLSFFGTAVLAREMFPSFMLAAVRFVPPRVRLGSEREVENRRPFLFIQEEREIWNLLGKKRFGIYWMRQMRYKL